MKLVELELTPVKKSIRTTRSPDAYGAVYNAATRSNSNLVPLGSPGAYGAAYEHKKRPGTVLKVGKFYDSPFEDGYLSFVQSILKANRSASNPYLPRIYSVKIYRAKPVKAKDGEMYTPMGGQYVIEMERLHKLDELSKEELIAIAERIFPQWDEQGNEHHQLSALLRAIGRAAQGKPELKQIKDRQLVRALALIHNIEKRKRNISDIEMDMHGGNYMVRRTPVGPQLVIIDPLA